MDVHIVIVLPCMLDISGDTDTNAPTINVVEEYTFFFCQNTASYILFPDYGCVHNGFNVDATQNDFNVL